MTKYYSMKLHDRIALNIIKKLDVKNIYIENNDKVKSYALYISQKTSINYSRAISILTIKTKRSITIIELMKIASILDVSLSDLL